MSTNIEARVRALIINKEYRSYLERILKKEKELARKYPDKPEWQAWEVGDVGVPPWIVMKFMNYGIVERVYASSRHRYYRLVDREVIERVLGESKVSSVRSHGTRKTHTSLKNFRLPDMETLFKTVVGYDDYKWILWKAVKKWLKGSKPAHFLLVGNPATGKTLFMECLEKHLPNIVYVAGESARRGGFVERIIEAYNRYGKEFILLIDEIDKLDSDAMKVLHNIMEGTLDIPVHGKQLTVKDVRIMVIATSNRPEKIPESIMSRFGQPLVFKTYDEEDFVKVSIEVLKEEGIDEELARKIAEKLVSLGVRDVRIPRQVGRIIESEEDIDKVIEILFKNRRFSRQ